MIEDFCGPHCGIQDGKEGHCERCHEIKVLAIERMEAHLNAVTLLRGNNARDPS